MNALGLAEEIIRASDREHPADAVLRDRFRKARGLARSESAETSRLVFAYYRWRGWLDERLPLSQAIEHASRLAWDYSLKPAGFSDQELLKKAVPFWTAQLANISAPFARKLQAEPALWLRARPGKSRDVLEALPEAKSFGKGRLAEILSYKGEKDLFRTAAFHSGLFELQDISSVAVGFICGAQPGQTWWDACAGEGGKTLHLSDTMQNRGLIWVSDRAEWRLRKLRLRAARAGVFNYRSAPWDGSERLPTKTLFDGVLVDAPCSGIGTWQRNPHARWTTTPEDVSEMAGVQQRLLHNASRALKPGGRLIYAVCTVTGDETTAVSEAFGASHPDFIPEPFSHPLLPGGSGSAALQLWPQDFGGNGLFIAVWKRAGKA